FCGLVSSTTLSDRLDPEDFRAIVRAYYRCCTELIECNGGFVATHMGDEVLAYFGYPQAHEHDAERAVRAGLALVEAMPKVKTVTAGPCGRASASPPGSWSWAISLMLERPRNCRSWARRRIWPLASKR